jgi:hypothetical protein
MYLGFWSTGNLQNLSRLQVFQECGLSNPALTFMNSKNLGLVPLLSQSHLISRISLQYPSQIDKFAYSIFSVGK